jgi:glycosyltransferase involved in cell wall biosynthesis
VLITSSYYWPEVAGSAPYLTGLAEFLAGRGHEVVVATGFAHYPDWKSSAGHRLAQREVRRDVQIRRRWHYVPRVQTAAHRAAYELSLLLFGLTALPWRWKPHVVVGTCPSLAGGALAAAAARTHRVPYGLVFQDLVGQAAEQSGVAGGARVARFVRGAELGLARHANGVAIVAEGFRPYLEQGGVSPELIYRLRNWTRRLEPDERVEETRRRLGWGPDDFVCVHGGNAGHKQGLDNLLDTASLLGDERVKIVLVGGGNDLERLRDSAHERSLANVEFVGPQAAGAWDAVLQAADVLLVNQRASVTDMSLPSKLTSYFAAGRPVVGAVREDSETAREIDSADAGVVVPPADPARLRDAILELRNDPDRAQRLGVNGKAYAESVLSAGTALAHYEDFVAAVAAKPS